MEKKEIPDEYYKWLMLPIEDKYQDALMDYLKKMPTGTISDFHLMEIKFWEGELAKDRGDEWFQTKLIVEGRKMLEYYKKLESVNKTNEFYKSRSDDDEDRSKKKFKKNVLEYKTLTEIFTSNDAYKKVMDKLIEEELIDKTSLEWTNFSTGYKSKIAALLYHLYYNKYFNCTKIPTPEQIKILAKNDFKVDIAIRTIKDKKINDLRKEFSFIKQFQP